MWVRPPADASNVWRGLHWFGTGFKRFVIRLEIEGRENVPATGGGVLACNHTLGADFLLLGYASPRQVYYMAKAEAFRIHPALSRLMLGAGVFPVERGKHDMAALETAVRLVQGGKVVGMFPEGTRSRNGLLQTGKTGAARIAMAAGAPVIPAAVLNAQGFMEGFTRLGPRPVAAVRFGTPLVGYGDAEDTETVAQFTETIMLGIAALLPFEQRGVYGVGFKDEEGRACH